MKKITYKANTTYANSDSFFNVLMVISNHGLAVIEKKDGVITITATDQGMVIVRELLLNTNRLLHSSSR